MSILLIHNLQLYIKCLYQKCLSPHMLQILHKEEGRFIEKQRGSDLWRPSIHTFHPTPPTVIIYNLIKDAFYNTSLLIKLNVRGEAQLQKLARTCTWFPLACLLKPWTLVLFKMAMRVLVSCQPAGVTGHRTLTQFVFKVVSSIFHCGHCICICICICIQSSIVNIPLYACRHCF